MEIEVRAVPYPEAGGEGVLLQLPDGFVLLKPADARRVADMLQDVAGEIDGR